MPPLFDLVQYHGCFILFSSFLTSCSCPAGSATAAAVRCCHCLSGKTCYRYFSFPCPVGAFTDTVATSGASHLTFLTY
eukprot:1157545-Pelagomonas_calceolata.AAC.4